MMRAAPWETLHMPKELACDFVCFFSRFEYALKAVGFVRRSPRGYAEPDWNRFGLSVSGTFNPASTPDVDVSVTYLL